MKREPEIEGIINREHEKDREITDPGLGVHDLLKVLYHLEMGVGNSLRDETSEDCYDYIPYSHLVFLKAMAAVEDRPNKSFLEVGCGPGTKLLLAQHVLKFGRAAGIEVNKAYAEVAKKAGCEVYHLDARDFKKYHKYDVVYMYHPLTTTAKQKPLEEKIRQALKSGAVLARPASCWQPNGIRMESKVAS